MDQRGHITVKAKASVGFPSYWYLTGNPVTLGCILQSRRKMCRRSQPSLHGSTHTYVLHFGRIPVQMGLASLCPKVCYACSPVNTQPSTQARHKQIYEPSHGIPTIKEQRYSAQPYPLSPYVQSHRAYFLLFFSVMFI
jgi:hypothetical protein